MKKIINLLSIAVVAAFAFTACTEESLVKSEIDAANQPAASTTPEISALKCTSANPSSLNFQFTVTGDSASIIEVGVIYSKSQSLEDSKFVKATGKVNETFTAEIKGLDQETDYYVQAYAYQAGGNVVSGVVKATTTFEPLSNTMLDGANYKASNIADYWGDTYNFDVTLVAGENDTVFVCDFDPYFASNGYVASKGKNILAGVLQVNEDQKSGVIVCEAGQAIGYKSCAFVGFANGELEEFSETIEFYVTNSGNNLATVNYVGVMDMDSQGFFCLYPPIQMVLAK